MVGYLNAPQPFDKDGWINTEDRVLDEGNGDENDFIHTEQFVLVDKESRIRGYYDGTEKEDMKKIIADIVLLKKEYTKK